MNWRAMILVTTISVSSTAAAYAADFSLSESKGDRLGGGYDIWSDARSTTRNAARLGEWSSRPFMSAEEIRRYPWTLIANTPPVPAPADPTKPGEPKPGTDPTKPDALPEEPVSPFGFWGPRFKYDFIRDGSGKTSTFHSLQPGAAFYWVPFGWLFQPEAVGIFEFGKVEDRNATRLGGVGRCTFWLLSNSMLDVGFGVEAGYISSNDVFADNSNDGAARIGFSVNIPVALVEVSFSWANEFYSDDNLSEFGFRLGLLRPMFPVGVVLGYRGQEAGDYAMHAFTVGIEVGF